MNRYILIITAVLSIIFWQCTKDDRRDLSLKESLEESVSKINTAFGEISESEGFRLISVTEDGTKSEESYNFRDSIDLELIAGIYDFNPGLESPRNFYFPFRLFEKTGVSDNLIINMPDKLVFHPRRLHFCDRADSVLENNFTINATDYHFYFTWWNNIDYELIADFTLDSEDIGNLSMFSRWESGTEGEYSKNFTFPEGYTVIRSGETGDTTKIVFALAEGEETLLMETLMFFGDGFKRKEKQYILTIGDVDIKRATGIDSIQVYFKGVLQQKAGAKIIDENADYNYSICHKRDILLTFDDGTTAKLSELISPALETLRSLSRSMGEMYFSRHIVDYIAFSIYYNNH